MFYKHWKKIALALTSFFWNSCDNAPTSVDSSGANLSSSSTDSQSSSSTDNNQSSSSVVAPASSSVPLYGVMSSIAESSSSFEQIMPAYGVYSRVTCYEDGKGVKTNGEVNVTKLICDDGVNCKEHEVLKAGEPLPCTPIDDGDLKGAVACPDYGIVYVSEKTYDCDGVKYNEAEFRTRYDRKYTTKPASSSSTEQSSSSQVTCSLDPTSFFYYNRSEKYTERQAISNATDRAKWEGSGKIGEIIREQFKDKDVPKCLEDIQESLEESFVALYGAPGNPIPRQYKCSDGTTYPTESYLEQQKFDEEQAKKKPQYDEKYNEVYKEETEKLDKEIEDCLNSEQSDD
ncbi:hypothetical protein [Fibrobacter sp. UWB11]|uniref:hypothetical protein n=1 Tax=Fibrobacter sp. UWB11 TaxID=1896202 RepID=UPI00092B5119|nr:hypothetical protein [Fibrobacter sp. UWB11]SIN93956.1 hypothetical protein SAMN05720758_0672 [Fibrobacter sp. UWB11]